MPTKHNELMIEQANLVRSQKDSNGKRNEFVTFRPRIRGDVEQNVQDGRAGFYPAGKPGRSKNTNDKEQTMSVEKFNKLMEDTGNELRVDRRKAKQGGDRGYQLVGKDTPDDQRPTMKVQMQAYGTKTKTGKDGQTYTTKAPVSNSKAEVFRVVQKSAQKSDFPDFNNEKHLAGAKKVRDAQYAKRQEAKAKQAEAPAKEEQALEPEA